MSRTVNGEKWFGWKEKEWLRKWIWRVAEFSGVRVVTYAVMDNHFHVLAEVPPAPDEMEDSEIVRRFRVLYPRPTPWQPLSPEALEALLRQNGVEGRRIRGQLLRRMHDISWMMKTIKQRFATAFNKSRERFGPVWSDRFKSVLIEADLKTLRAVAAYIDLNAVRAGKAKDPKDYRFCGYGEAVAGIGRAREGLALLDRSLSGYRQTLFGAGGAPREGKESFSRSESLRVIEIEKGKLPLADILRCRIRYFTDGLILGSQDFVETMSSSNGVPRKRRARGSPLPGADWQGLTALRGIRKDRFS